MKTAATLGHPALADHPPTGAEAVLLRAAGKAAAYLALTKPRIAVMVLVTVATGFVLGARRSPHPTKLFPATFFLALVGTALVAGGASAWNQYLERSRDRRMKRTANRPLPSRKLSPTEAVVFGTALGVVGLIVLAWGTNLTAAVVALTTFVLYVFVYTPLKWRTTLNTAVGALPGALPPVIGWAAATGQVGVEAWSLFLIVFLWQFPHFLAIAWIYRDDYARAGYKMLPNVDPLGRITGRQAAGYALALIPAGLLPSAIGLAGSAYFTGSLFLGSFYLLHAVRFWAETSDPTARRLLRASFLYLPAALILLLLNPLPA